MSFQRIDDHGIDAVVLEQARARSARHVVRFVLDLLDGADPVRRPAQATQLREQRRQLVGGADEQARTAANDCFVGVSTP